MAMNKPKQLHEAPKTPAIKSTLFDFTMRQKAMDLAVQASSSQTNGKALVKDAEDILAFLKGGFEDMPGAPPRHVSADPQKQTMTYHF